MQLPHRFGKYLLTRKIAEGGMAEVYCAKYFGERGFTRELAVKRILPKFQNHRDYERMFIDEANILVKLQHPNIVQVFELGRDQDALFISMEYVDGVDLRRLIRKLLYEETELSEKYIHLIILETLKALVFAHNRCDENGASLEIIHRDISPQNILCSFSGEIKLTDFGIAKSASRTSTTQAGQVKGKYAYMSPEQARGEDVTRATDIYSLGIIFYELMTGKRLFDGPNDFSIVEQVKNGVLAEGWALSIPARLRTIFRRMLDGNLDTRFSSASELLDELNTYVEDEGLTTTPMDFAVYLKELFKAERNLAICEGDIVEREINLAEVTRSEIGLVDKRSKYDVTGHKWRRSVISALSFTMLGTLCIGAKGGMATVPEAIVLPLPQIDLKPQKEIKIVELEQKNETPTIVPIDDMQEVASSVSETKQQVKEKITDGMISVVARPWGYVTIPGIVLKKETPVVRSKVAEGRYLVKVYYEPEAKVVEKYVSIDGGQRRNCIADFRSKATITCR